MRLTATMPLFASASTKATVRTHSTYGAAGQTSVISMYTPCTFVRCLNGDKQAVSGGAIKMAVWPTRLIPPVSRRRRCRARSCPG